MSSRLPRLTAVQVTRALERAGFRLARRSRSHMIYRNDAGRRVTVPAHAGKILHPKVLESIPKDADLSVTQLLDLL